MAKGNQKNQEKKGNKVIKFIGGFAIAAAISLVIFLGGGFGSGTIALAGPAPAGLNCEENRAYMQTAVNKYKEVVGEFPTDVNQLLETVDGKAACAERLVGCPSEGPYTITNGIVE